jgi:hypothetical protein
VSESKPTILSRITTCLIVAVVTLLIWLLAESESLRTDRRQAKLTFLADAESSRLIRVEPNQEFNGTVMVEFEGSTAAVDSVIDALRKELRLEPGSEGVPGAPGSYTIQLQTALSALPAFRNPHVTVSRVEPPTLNVVVDNLITREASVRVELPESQTLDGAPEVTPTTVKVRFPESLAKSVPPDFQVTARLDAARIQNLPEGRRTTLQAIPLETPEALRSSDSVRMTPPQVNIALTLRSRTASYTVPTVPVHLRIAATELSIWDIQLAPESRLLTDVNVSGPADTIDLIRTDKLKLIAYVPLGFDELEKAAASGEPIDKEPVFCDLPTTLKFDYKQKSVRLTVKRRESPSPAPNGPVRGAPQG